MIEKMKDAHAMSSDEVYEALGAGRDGLTRSDVEERTETYGLNQIEEERGSHPVVRFFAHFNDILIYILLAAAALKAFIGDWIEFGVILGVAVINAVIGFIQEGRAEQALAGIRGMLSEDAQALRDGQWVEIPAEELVPGDTVRVSAGSRVPADIRLAEADNLRAEESALTGESVPSDKSVDPVNSDAAVGDRSSMLYSSSLISAGQGAGVVTATGQDAEIGRITSMLSDVDRFDTPLIRQIKDFSTKLAAAIGVVVVIVFLIARFVHQMPLDEMVGAMIGLAVAAIPEGLPALVTITLALGVQQMARRNAIVRKLPAVETLGSVTRICSDKTGTLTTNEMTVRTVVTTAHTYHVEGLGYEPAGRILLDDDEVDLQTHSDLQSVVAVMSVVNDADVREGEDRWELMGEPTEGALRTLGMKAGFDPGTYPREAILPFDSEHKYMATANSTPSGERMILVKGAPDRLLDRAVLQLSSSGETESLDRQWWEDRVDQLSNEGLRVLAAARRSTSAEGVDHDDVDELMMLGLTGIVDPPRPEAIDAIAMCHSAGIKVTMITGDHTGTATAISREMGISDGETAVTGAELESASDEELREIVGRTETFARTSPEHKLRLVRAFQANGEVVAMTGDGVNDAPALKRADVGVAMGIKGTEATKEAADIVLADDNFATIEHAVEEGRRINDNLQKPILFLLPTNGAQSLVVLFALVFGLTMPLEPVQILWINMVTAVTLSLALAYEPAEDDVMQRHPRAVDSPLVSAASLPRIAVVSLLIAAATAATFHFAGVLGATPEEAQTWAINTLALAQTAYLFNSRFTRKSSLSRDSFGGNPVAWIVVGVLMVLQIAFVYLPILNRGFGSAPVTIWGWLVPLGFALAVFLFVEAWKAVSRRS